MKRVFIFPMLILMLTACTSTSPASSPTNGSDQTAPAATSLSPLGETGAPTGGFAQGSRTPTAFTSPFTPEQTTALTDGGYVIGTDGTVKDRSGRAFLTSSPDGKSWTTLDGKEYPKTELHIVVTNGVDFSGKDIGAMLVFGEGKDKMMVLPTTGETVQPIDIVTFQKLMDQVPAPTAAEWGSYENVQFADIPEVPWGADKSGQIFYSAQLALRPWPENVREPVLQYMAYNNQNRWILSEYPTRAHEDNIFGFNITVERPILFENDGVRNLGAVKMKNPSTGEWEIIKLQQYLYEGHTVVLQMPYGGEYANPESGEFSLTQKSLSNPPWIISEPVVSTPKILSFLPLALRQLIDKFADTPVLPNSEERTYPVGDEIYALQKILFESLPVTYQHAFQSYLRSEDDPIFDNRYP